MSMGQPTSEKTWTPLSHRERRVLGVLIEKQKTTPDVYPLTVNALVAGCNQKSNRDPVTNYDEEDVEEALHSLRSKGAVAQYEGTGRVVRWKHNLYDWLDLRNKPAEMAVIAELLLRGAQTEGDLRARASRMDPIPDLSALQVVLEDLVKRGLVVYLSPPGQRRGVVVTHGLYPPEELERVKAAHARSMAAADDASVAAGPSQVQGRGGSEVEALRAEVEALRGEVRALAAEVRELKSALGA
ncbi:MAG TPA: DUF480 domain-containing protein [Isosphaeraceae bacterium]|jgi:hypothetical protein|nr:DUF480 domain-containing protein [Isosphaeraceae bacterium]